jgi:ankyrin repeat protein
MRAASSGNVEAVQLLLQASADVNITDDDGNTTMAYAKQGGHVDVMAVLRGAEAQPVITKTVLVLGAGFTRAFLPMLVQSNTPLSVADRRLFAWFATATI